MSFSFWPFSREKEEESGLKTEIKQAFSAVKQDINKAAEWIAHLHEKNKHHEAKFEGVDVRLSSVENDLEELRNFVTFFSSRVNRGFSKQVFKQGQTPVHKQTAVGGVQTPVQTGVQTAFLGNLSVMERAIVWVLLNTNMKLSCEDISAILNKERTTIRGQLNAIKQKSENLIEEMTENNGKKRYFVDDNIKEMILSGMSENKNKVRIKKKNALRKH